MKQPHNEASPISQWFVGLQPRTIWLPVFCFSPMTVPQATKDENDPRFPLVSKWQMNLPNFSSNELISKRSSRKWRRRQKDVCHLLILLALVFPDYACQRGVPSLVLKILIPGCGWNWVLRSTFCLLPHKALRTIKTSLLFCRIILVMLMLTTMENGGSTRRMGSWR